MRPFGLRILSLADLLPVKELHLLAPDLLSLAMLHPAEATGRPALALQLLRTNNKLLVLVMLLP